MCQIRMIPGHRGPKTVYPGFADDAARQVRQFHATVPGYAPTPLHTVTGPATLLVKDESYRFGLNAFKALGGSYAMARLLTDPALTEMKTAIGLTEASRVLLFSTEGDTDRGRYREIMDGAWPAPELK